MKYEAYAALSAANPLPTPTVDAAELDALETVARMLVAAGKVQMAMNPRVVLEIIEASRATIAVRGVAREIAETAGWDTLSNVR